ncbi:MAG: Minf_1886 family protein [Verrucomicrobiota bacterium]
MRISGFRFDMKKINLTEALEQILRDDPRYDVHAYLFLREALDFTIKMLAKPSGGPQRHVSGGELLDGIRQYALQEFGPMAKTVLNRWGIKCCEDFGEIVFNLVGKGILGRTEQDKKEDFAGGYDFDEAFCQPFRPGAKAGSLRKAAPKRPESAQNN